jgi:hypothetical protein
MSSTARQIGVLTFVATGAIVLAVTLALAGPKRAAPGSPVGRPPAQDPARTPTPPRLNREQINEQERVAPEQRRQESMAFQDRPLLQHLPLTRAGVKVDIGGLAPDGHRPMLTLSLGERTPGFARRIYRRALRQTGDDGDSYVVVLVR